MRGRGGRNIVDRRLPRKNDGGPLRDRRPIQRAVGAKPNLKRGGLKNRPMQNRARSPPRNNQGGNFVRDDRRGPPSFDDRPGPMRENRRSPLLFDPPGMDDEFGRISPPPRGFSREDERPSNPPRRLMNERTDLPPPRKRPQNDRGREVERRPPPRSEFRRMSPLPPRRSPLPPPQQRRSPMPPQQHRRSPIPLQQHRRSPIPLQQHRRSPIPLQQHRRSPIPLQQHRRSPIPPQHHRRSPIQQQRRSSVPPQQRGRSPLPMPMHRRSPPPPQQRRRSPLLPSPQQRRRSRSPFQQQQYISPQRRRESPPNQKSRQFYPDQRMKPNQNRPYDTRDASPLMGRGEDNRFPPNRRPAPREAPRKRSASPNFNRHRSPDRRNSGPIPQQRGGKRSHSPDLKHRRNDRELSREFHDDKKLKVVSASLRPSFRGAEENAKMDKNQLKMIVVEVRQRNSHGEYVDVKRGNYDDKRAPQSRDNKRGYDRSPINDSKRYHSPIRAPEQQNVNFNDRRMDRGGPMPSDRRLDRGGPNIPPNDRRMDRGGLISPSNRDGQLSQRFGQLRDAPIHPWKEHDRQLRTEPPWPEQFRGGLLRPEILQQEREREYEETLRRERRELPPQFGNRDERLRVDPRILPLERDMLYERERLLRDQQRFSAEAHLRRGKSPDRFRGIPGYMPEPLPRCPF